MGPQDKLLPTLGQIQPTWVPASANRAHQHETVRSTHFDRGLLPHPRSFYELELGRLTRSNSKGWSLGNCPFHKSKSGKSFSVHVDGAFYCHGCPAKGSDLIAFVRLRDRVNFKEAAQRLGAWRDHPLSASDQRRLDHEHRERERKLQAQSDQKELERRHRLALRDDIHALAALQREASEQLSQLRRGAAEALEGEAEDCWAVLTLVLDDLRSSEDAYMRISGLER